MRYPMHITLSNRVVKWRVRPAGEDPKISASERGKVLCALHLTDQPMRVALTVVTAVP